MHHDGKIEKIDQKADLPLLTSGFTNSMRNCPTGSPIHVRLIAEFDEISKDRIFLPTADSSPVPKVSQETEFFGAMIYLG